MDPAKEKIAGPEGMIAIPRLELNLLRQSGSPKSAENARVKNRPPRFTFLKSNSLPLFDLDPLKMSYSPRTNEFTFNDLESPKGYTFKISQITAASKVAFCCKAFSDKSFDGEEVCKEEDTDSREKEAGLPIKEYASKLFSLGFLKDIETIEKLIEFVAINKIKLMRDKSLSYPLHCHVICDAMLSFYMVVFKNGRILIHFYGSKNEQKCIDNSGYSNGWYFAWEIMKKPKMYAFGISQYKNSRETNLDAQKNSEKYLIKYNNKPNFPKVHGIFYFANRQMTLMRLYKTDLSKKLSIDFSDSAPSIYTDRVKIEIAVALIKALQLMHEGDESVTCDQSVDRNEEKVEALELAPETVQYEKVEEDEKEGHIHGDMKPENVLLDEDDRPVLADFGFSGTVKEKQNEKVSHGTDNYLSYEAYKGVKYKNPKDQDLWGLGNILWHLFFQKFTPWGPIAPKSYSEAASLIVAFNKQHSHTDNKVIQLFHKIFNPDPTLRPTLSELKDTIEEFGKTLKQDDSQTEFKDIKIPPIKEKKRKKRIGHQKQLAVIPEEN